MNYLPTPPYYNYSPNKQITRDDYINELEKERMMSKRLGKIKKYMNIFGTIVLIIFYVFVVFLCYIHMNWFSVHPLLFLFSTIILINAIYHLVSPMKDSSLDYHYTPNCSEQEQQEAIERAQLAYHNFKKLIETNYPCRYCLHCQHFIPQQTYHCLVCNKCILKRDHHCSWLGTCIGEKNMRQFWQLLFAIFLIAVVGVIHFGSFWNMQFLFHGNLTLILFLEFLFIIVLSWVQSWQFL